MHLTLLTLAHDIHYSEPGNLLNITGIYSGMTSAVFPFTVPRVLLVARFTGSPVEYGREFEIMVNFVDEDGLLSVFRPRRRRDYGRTACECVPGDKALGLRFPFEVNAKRIARIGRRK